MTTPKIPPPFTAYQGAESHLFVCFAHENAPTVYSDINWLHESGVNIWYDEGISPGHLWREDIANAIDQCSLFVVFLSAAAAESPNCRKEINFALEAGKRFLVIYLEEVTLPPGVSLAIGEIQGILRYVGPEKQYRQKVLGHIGESLGSEFKDSGTPSQVSRQPRWNFRILLLATLLLAAGIAWLFEASRKTTDSVAIPEFVFTPREWVLLVFENDTDNSLFEGSLETALRISLSESAYINLLSRSRTRDSLRRMGRADATRMDRFLGMEVALREGVSAVLDARIEQEDDKYKLSVNIVDPKTNSTVYSHSAKAKTEAQLLPELSIMADTLRSALGEPEEMIQERSVLLQRATTANLDALRIYSLAVETAYTVSLEETIDLLEQALLLDPDFALAHAKIATYILAVDGDKSIAQSHFEVAISRIDRLSQRERLYVEASQAWLEAPEEMERRWQLLARVYPDEIAAHHNLGAVRWEYFNDFAGAVPHLREALKLDPNNGGSLYYLGYCLLALGETEEAIWTLEKSNDLTGMAAGLADAYIILEDYQLAGEFLMVSDEPTPGEQIPRITRLVSLELDQNNFQIAYDLASEGFKYAEQVAAYLSVVGFSGAKLAISTNLDTAPFEQELESATSLIFRLIDEDRFLRKPARELALIGKLAARHGHLPTARQLADYISSNVDHSGNPLSQDYAGLLAAEIVMAEGDLETAVQLFELIIASSNLFQAHEGLARASSLNGDHERELAELSWLAGHKGQALVQMSDTMMGREMNLLDWQIAVDRLNTP